MLHCDACGAEILFGGSREAGRRYCDERCLERGRSVIASQHFTEEALDRAVRDVHAGPCPRCGRPRLVDTQRYGQIVSLILFTWSSTQVVVACRRCGRFAQFGGLILCLLLGWWSVPGLLCTPLYLVANVIALCRRSMGPEPSDDLRQVVRAGMAAEAMKATTKNG